jgi:putative inorganic carbon (hco3(-)) transporter
MKFLNFLNRVIEYGFYAILLLVPLAFTSDTSELFEFNKLWLTFGLTIIIAIAWLSKMVVEKKVRVQRTPLDIPILLFLASQIISTIFSIDKHVSLWGYYSRFNGGLYSIIVYIFLYYTFVSNLASLKIVRRILKVSLISGAIVALWGLPSHFGYDPTCLAFRGSFDVSCWTNDFQPKIRIFSSMGQPDWMAAYLDILLPISLVMFFESLKFTLDKAKKLVLAPKGLRNAVVYLLLTVLFYADLMYTNSKSGAIAGWIGIIIVIAVYLIHKFKIKLPENKHIKFVPIYLVVLFAILTFLTSIPFPRFQQYTLTGVINNMQTAPVSKNTPAKPNVQTVTTTTAPHLGELGGTDSSRIRTIVWEGALNIWKNNPLFGSGVETFAYAYYNYRPTAHNMTSEWNFLYNKAHNEFLNYLATTGLFGLGSYLAFIILFLVLYCKILLKLHKEKGEPEFLAMALVASFVTILITNFFGFSVVVTNIYLFVIPALTFAILDLIKNQNAASLPQGKTTEKATSVKINAAQYITITVFTIIGTYALIVLFVFWNADKNYAYGMNLDQAKQYQQARAYLVKAVEQRPGEPTFRSEYAINSSVLAALFAQQKNTTQSAQFAQSLAQEASAVVDNLTASYPKNVVYWKTKVRVDYALASQINPQYLGSTLQAIQQAANLAPTDANIIYNMAVITGQSGDVKKAVEILQRTIKLKPDYFDAYFALAIFYEDLAINSNPTGPVVNRDYHKKAIDELKFILKYLAPNDERTKNTLASWEKK